MKPRSAILVLGLTACATENNLFDWMDPDWREDWSEHTRVQRLGEVRILPGGPPLGPENTPIWGTQTDRVVVDLGPPMRVLLEIEDVALLAYVDEENVPNFVVETLEGGANPSRSGEAGATFIAGTEVDLLEQGPNGDLVAVRGGNAEVEIWLAPESIAPYFHLDPQPLAESEGEFTLIRDGAALLDSPGGEVFGYVQADEDSLWSYHPSVENDVFWRPATALEPASEGAQLIEIGDEKVQVRAYVDNADLDTRLMGMGARGHGFGCRGFYFAPNVEAGTELYDDLDGEVVGWVTQHRYFDLEFIDSNWARAPLSTTFNTGMVWIRMEDVEFQEGLD